MSEPGLELWELPLDYPIRPLSRFGHGKPSHPHLKRILERGREDYRRLLTAFLEYKDDVLAIPVPYDESTEPCWDCGWLMAGDIIALYGMVRLSRPAHYIEVGSGSSTKIIRRAIKDGGLPTTIWSIDPHPREDIDLICDRVVRSPLEGVDLELFESVEAGDVIFIDGSHRSFENSDATVMFLEILPSLPAGVHVACHDIFLPDDYPPAWWDRFYSEQYLIAAMVLAEGRRFEVEFPGWFVSNDEELNGLLDPILCDPRLERVPKHGGTFWFRTNGDSA